MTVIGVLGGAVVVFAYVNAWLFVVGLAVDEEQPFTAAVLAVALVGPLILCAALIMEDSDSSKHCEPINQALRNDLTANENTGIITPAQPREPRNLQATVDYGP